MEVRLLGPLQVLDEDGRLIEVRGTKPKALLALLALRVGEVVPSGRIIEEVWGEQAIRDPLNAVQVVVSKLRRALGALSGRDGRPLITTTEVGYRLDVGSEVIDVVRFERLSGEGRRLVAVGDPAVAAASLRDALGLWQGPALVDFDDDFCRGDRTRLEELRATTLELRIDADLSMGRHQEVAAELASLTSEQPLRERWWGQLMLALYRSGRQADALRAYQAARLTLQEGLGLEPGPALRRLEAAVLAGDPDLDLQHETAPPLPTVTPDLGGGNLPVALSSFVGRSDELREVRGLAAGNRLVTIVGPGGAGKTRLALEVADRMAGEHADGVWLVELGALRDPRHVASVTAQVLGLDDEAGLERFVADKALLVILDNCEHVVDEAARVAQRLLQGGRRVRVLATSREHLGVPGEAVWTLPPLAEEDAARLFVARAHGTSADLTADRSELVGRICARLDGLPLAVELAAARTRSLALGDIVDRIDDRFRLLTAGARTAHPRQQTLRGVVDWSYDLLLAEEQRVFRRLAVFAGGFDLAAAEAVCPGDDVAVEDVVDVVGRLVDKSLVSVIQRDGSARYRLLETLAAYGRARLAEAGEAAATSDRHLRWMLDVAGRAEAGLRGVDQPQWTARLGVELENARAALEWAVQRGSAAAAVALAAGFAYGWYVTGTIQEGRAFIVRALAQSGESSPEQRAIAGAWGGWLTQIGSGATGDAVALSEDAVATARGRTVRGFCTAAVVAALLRAYRGRTVEAIELVEEAATVLAQSPDRWLQAYVDWVRSGLRLKTGDAEQARQLLEHSFSDFAAEGDRYGQAITSIRLGELAEMRGDLDEAIAATTFGYEGTMRTGPGANASILATRLGNLAALQGRFDDASAWHETALNRARELSFPGPAAQALSGMAVAAELQGRRDDAESLHREALAAYEAVGSVEGAAFTLVCLGALAADAGDGVTAAALHHDGLARAVQGSDRRAIGFAVLGLAGVQAIHGDGCSAALLVGAASQIRGEVDPPGAPFRRERERVESRSRALVGEAPFDAARESGRRQADTVLARLTSGEPLPN